MLGGTRSRGGVSGTLRLGGRRLRLREEASLRCVHEGLGGTPKLGGGSEIVAVPSAAFSIAEGIERPAPRLRRAAGSRSRPAISARPRGRTLRGLRFCSSPLALGLRGREGGPERRRRTFEPALGSGHVASRQLRVRGRCFLLGPRPEPRSELDCTALPRRFSRRVRGSSRLLGSTPFTRAGRMRRRLGEEATGELVELARLREIAGGERERR